MAMATPKHILGLFSVSFVEIGINCLVRTNDLIVIELLLLNLLNIEC